MTFQREVRYLLNIFLLFKMEDVAILHACNLHGIVSTSLAEFGSNCMDRKHRLTTMDKDRLSH